MTDDKGTPAEPRLDLDSLIRDLKCDDGYDLNRYRARHAATALAAERDRADRAEARLAALGREWRVLNGAGRDIFNGRPVDEALEEQADSRAAIDRLFDEATA